MTIVVAASLAAAVPAGAQQPASPDAAPTGSQRPAPRSGSGEDHAEGRDRRPPGAAAGREGDDDRQAGGARATTPARTADEQARAPRGDPPARRPSGARRARTRRRAAPHVAMPPLPRLTLAHLSAPPTTTDAGRARKLAAGALSLLILALASATLLAFTARVERRRVAR